jgi:uncharacterized protein (DUF302 family)
MSAGQGLVTKPSKYSVAETIERLENVLAGKGIKVFARIDHSGEAEKAGLKMLPAQVLIFGNPKAGTPLMVAEPTAAIDLPLKVLVWQDQEGRVWLSYNSPDYLKQRFGLTDDLIKNVGVIEILASQALA